MDNSKERLDAYMKLAEFWSARADARRTYELRMVFGFAALMIAAIAYLPRNAFTHLVMVCVLLGYILLFMHGNWLASTRDKLKAWHFVDAAIRMTIETDYRVTKFDEKQRLKERARWRDFRADWSQKVQMAIAILLGLAWFLLPPLAKLGSSS